MSLIPTNFPSFAVRSIPMWAWILTAALLVIGVQQWRVHHYQAQAIALQGLANKLHEANRTNLSTIATLQSANADWAQKCTAEVHEARQQAQLSVAADRKNEARLDASVKTLRAEAQNDVSVKAWYDQPLPAGAVRMLTQGGSTY